MNNRVPPFYRSPINRLLYYMISLAAWSAAFLLAVDAL